MVRTCGLILFFAWITCAQLLMAEDKNPYFPKMVFGKNVQVHSFVENWYSKHLRAMNEQSIYAQRGNKEIRVCRFTCLRSFDRPFCIRVESEKGMTTVITKILSGKGGYDPGELEETKKNNIDAKALNSLELLLSSIEFSKMKSVVEDEQLDGAQWIFESLVNGKYKIVDRTSPKKGSKLGRIAEWFFEHAEWRPKDLY